MKQSKLSFRARCTTPDIVFTVKLNDEVIYRGSLESDPREISHGISDEEGDHVLSLIMTGKLSDHTIMDYQGNILQDHVIEITDFAFDDVQLGHVLTDQAVYEHNFNGSGQKIREKFYGTMGCNGTVTMKFITPIYLWLLENM